MVWWKVISFLQQRWMKFFILFFFSFSFSLGLLSQDRFHDFENFDKRIDKIFQEMRKEFLGHDLSFFEGFDHFPEGQGLKGGAEFEWRENLKEKILVIKGIPKGKGKAPLDITLKEGRVNISGSLEIREKQKNAYRQSHYRFKQSVEIPSGTDLHKMRVENKENEVHIIFPKTYKSHKIFKISIRVSEKTKMYLQEQSLLDPILTV